jgi:hypothetical protein
MMIDDNLSYTRRFEHAMERARQTPAWIAGDECWRVDVGAQQVVVNRQGQRSARVTTMRRGPQGLEVHTRDTLPALNGVNSCAEARYLIAADGAVTLVGAELWTLGRSRRAVR